MKTAETILWLAAALLSNVMCAVVAYNWCALEWGGRYAGYSAPPDTALLYAIPFLVGIAGCVTGALLCKRREKRKE